MLLCRDPQLATCDPCSTLGQPVAAAFGVLTAEVAGTTGPCAEQDFGQVLDMKTRPTRSRVVYASTITRELLASFPWWPESYQPPGRRYWPAGSGSWLFCRSAIDSLAHQCRPAPAVAAPRRSPAR
jgi:hypothetical protein